MPRTSPDSYEQKAKDYADRKLFQKAAREYQKAANVSLGAGRRRDYERLSRFYERASIGATQEEVLYHTGRIYVVRSTEEGAEGMFDVCEPAVTTYADGSVAIWRTVNERHHTLEVAKQAADLYHKANAWRDRKEYR